MKYLDKINFPSDIKSLDIKALNKLATELREKMVEDVSKTGGHLAGSLGVVELTIALHYVFDTPVDKLIFDVGHQAYAHKILTGRKDNFHTLRQKDGISGFPKPSESEYDPFVVGHSSTAISAALGMAVARDIKGEQNKVIAVVGDGGMTGGLSFEGLNNAGHLDRDMLVILNDNEMFISDRVGALGKYLTKVLTTGLVTRIEDQIERFAAKMKTIGGPLVKLAKRVKVFFTPGMIFEELGFCYLGPVDGHDIEGLIEVFEKIKNLKGPIFLHILTKKGKGYLPAETNPSVFHGVGKFNKDTGEVIKSTQGNITYTKVFSDTVVDLATSDDKVVAITAAMPEGTGLTEFRDKFKDRYFDVGIAEGHALTFAAGLSSQGLKPVCAIYSTFLQRAYDQIIHDICLQKLPIIMAIDRAGIVGEDGATHHGNFDLSYLRIIPNLIIMAPKDENELKSMLKSGLDYNLPVAIRYPRGKGLGVTIKDYEKINLGEPELIKSEGSVAVIAIGNMVTPSLAAVNKLEQEEGLEVMFINARFVKPMNKEIFDNIADKVDTIITVEENSLMGGFGSAVRELLSDKNIPIYSIGLPDEFIEHGSQEILRDMLNLTEDKIYTKLKKVISKTINTVKT